MKKIQDNERWNLSGNKKWKIKTWLPKSQIFRLISSRYLYLPSHFLSYPRDFCPWQKSQIPSIKMDRYLCLFLFLFLTLFVEMRGGRDECMTSNRCGDQGPLIQFPFRLKHQPHHCGYPGFNLSCTENNQTMLDLPVSVKLLVKKIAYKSREILVQDPDNCLARQLGNLNLAASPFPFKFEKGFVTLFNCSSDKIETYGYDQSIPCLSIPGNPVYAVYSFRSVQYTDLSSCRRLYNASVPLFPLFSDHFFCANCIFNGSAFSLKWSKSICRSCPEGGKICRLKKSNSREPETECIKGKETLHLNSPFIFFSSFMLTSYPLLWFNIQML